MDNKKVTIGTGSGLPAINDDLIEQLTKSYRLLVMTVSKNNEEKKRKTRKIQKDKKDVSSNEVRLY